MASPIVVMRPLPASGLESIIFRLPLPRWLRVVRRELASLQIFEYLDLDLVTATVQAASTYDV